jgi:RNA polymerase sigma-70 factor (ECF subfamily)
VVGSPKEISDQRGSLLTRLREGDADALSEVYGLYRFVMYSLILRIVRHPSAAEDLVQEAFLKAWSGAHRLNPEYDDVGPWLLSIARNCALDFRKRSESRLTIYIGSEIDLISEKIAGFGVLPCERAKIIRDACRVLTYKQLRVIELAYYEDRSQTEIAILLGEPLGTIKGRLRAALHRLRGAIEMLASLHQ